MGFSRARALGVIGGLVTAGPLGLEAALSANREDPADLKLLNILLATTQAGVALYNGAISANVLTTPVALVIAQFAGDHAAHRDALILLVSSGGGTPVSSAQTPAPVPPHSNNELLNVALAFERQATGIFLSSIPDFKNRAFAKTAGSILGVDAGHVALLAEALKQNPAFPTGFVTT